MPRTVRLLAILALTLLPLPAGFAQEKSVNPGINDSFRDPDVREFEGRFEVESREVFARRKEIVTACQIKPGMTVADIGAGTGLFTRLFSEAVGKEGRVIAVDISQKFLDHVQKTSRAADQRNVDILLCQADSTGLPPNSIDLAFICDTYHHFEFPIKTMRSIERALKPGGRVILVDFRRISGVSTDWVLNHVRAGQEVFEAEIVQAGLHKLRDESELLQENYFVVFKKAAPTQQVFPIIAQYGGVIARPSAIEQPRAGMKVVFDVMTDAKPTDVNKGLERLARLLNLYGAAGLQAKDVSIAVVLHGDATKCVLNDAACKQRFGVEQNPNRPLIQALQQAGVEISVCGQALHNKGISDAEVAEGIPIATSALTLVINKQADGYSYVLFP